MLQGHVTELVNAVWGSDGQWITTCDVKGGLKVWDLNSGNGR
ncbi:MAG TPA: hypothetical protein VLD67_04575 [Vicinamibacterales bacterium]|nr:hypothetical protein [Vicinamibacterales bacterium]